jgi:D-alanyl-lipoteichoic acid acyltransferase DltB (MBOAT superfamily)
MNFNSFSFWMFFFGITALYYGVTHKNRPASNTVSRLLLLAASLFFYVCWNKTYLVLILFSVLVTWISGILMEGKSRGRRILVLSLSLAANLAILFFFKYWRFFTENAGVLAAKLGGDFRFPVFNVLLPVGISFYTFQALGYSIDVFCGRVKAERNFLNYALFVTFFPQLVAGPIERTANLLPQFKVNHAFDYDRAVSGLRLALWGMVKKVLVADRLAVYVNAVYGDPAVYPSATLTLATVFFAFQIYCDFSGYSDIAIGTARVLGFDLMTNFRSPYFSRSIAEFWRRWHISLSTWLKDYLYIPLGGGRRGKTRQMINLFVTFLLSGLWHGAAWHFIAWGFLHGLYQMIGRAAMPYRAAFREKLGLREEAPPVRIVETAFVFFLICAAWIFFRAENMRDALVIYEKLFYLPRETLGYLKKLSELGLTATIRRAFNLGGADLGFLHPIKGFYLKACAFSVLSIGSLTAFDFFREKVLFRRMAASCPLVIRWAGYYVISYFLLERLADTANSQFIYFTF